MDNLDKLIVEAEKNGGWNDGFTDKYLSTVRTEEADNRDDKCVVRPYERHDESVIEELAHRVSYDSISEMVDEGCYINVLDNGKSITGMIAARDDGEETYIRAIAVDSEYEGHGYAQRLIGHIDTGDRLVAKVDVSNVRSLNLFEKYGFENGNIIDGMRWMIKE